MNERDIEKLVLGIDEDETEAWKRLQENWTGGVLAMPIEETERRKEYKKHLKAIFEKAGITPDNITDPWLAGKVRRILK